MIELVFGNILDFHEADAIVNPTDPWFSGSGGLDYQIQRAAGSKLQKECQKQGKLNVGETILTPAFELPFQHIIHTVGPVWKDGSYGEIDELWGCYRSVLTLAERNSIGAIAIPAIATGTYQFPIKLSVEIAISAIQEFTKMPSANLQRIVLVCDMPAIYQQYKISIKELTNN